MLHLAFRNNFTIMNFLSEHVIAPIRQLQTKISSCVPFSLAELLIALVIGWILFMLIKRKWKKLLTGAITLSLFTYAMFCLLWGTYYYGTPETETDPISVEDLTKVTQYFANLANESYVDEPDRDEVLAKSKNIYGTVQAKGIVCSKIMSMIDFQGFFFPITGEANVNMDSPAHDLPSTVAHELSHLQGTAREQEANFEAVRTCLEYGDPDYVYSASLLAYTYLGNALYPADYEEWAQIYSTLSSDVINDLKETNEYWKQYETPVQEISNTVYENFLYSYGQDLGLKSYGACVDLIVNYYKDRI